jgi:Protein of unknown function (DUF2848)
LTSSSVSASASVAGTLLAGTLLRADSGNSITALVEQLILCGWTGRDDSVLSRHVEELAALGVARPSRVPCYYRAAASLLTTERAIQVLGPDTSGEVEPVLLGTAGGVLVGLGSDHTDRGVESYSIAVSKQLCSKPVASEFWLLSDVLPHWDELILRSFAHIDGVPRLYQESSLNALRHPEELVIDCFGSTGHLPEAVMMFCGTVPAISGIKAATRFEMVLIDPVLKRTIEHGYDVSTLPKVS